MEIDYHFIRETLLSKELSTQLHCSTYKFYIQVLERDYNSVYIFQAWHIQFIYNLYALA